MDLKVSGPIFIKISLKNVPRIKSGLLRTQHSVRGLPGSLSPPVRLPAVSFLCVDEQTCCRRTQWKHGEGTGVTSNPARERLER